MGQYNSFINSIIPNDSQQNTWEQLDIYEELTFKHPDFTKFLKKKINIYSLYQFFEIFIKTTPTNLENNNTKLVEILPNTTKFLSKNNICYFTHNGNNLYLNLNEFKYNVHISKIKNTDLYFI